VSRSDEGKIPDDALVQEFAAGIVGHGLVASLFSYITLGNELPSFDDIIKDPAKTKVPSRADAQMIVVYELAARVEEDMMDPVVTYVERFPKEFSVSFAKAACRREPDLLNTPAITRWCATNRTRSCERCCGTSSSSRPRHPTRRCTPAAWPTRRRPAAAW
jgi:hypothetical protein